MAPAREHEGARGSTREHEGARGSTREHEGARGSRQRRAHRESCTASHLLFLEWDVRFAAKLGDAFPIPGDFFCPEVQPRNSDWPWWREIPHLPSSLRGHATGIAPLAAILLSRRALDAILAHPECEEALAAPVFCEVRLPTLAAAAGFPPQAHPALANVRFTGCDPHAAIAHPVKV
ncbi:hypothetical protein [Haloferula sp. BvORR071]|uniref:hypothetical protein n=1 Tax=Haloferula sp. BvORR071 TaxID=1396141 RepID=UPI00054D9B11|nr:hypothetical protein [Haloferula sp. BvORR071]